MKHILLITVNNSSGVLSHLVALFTRRGYNIDSLSVGETHDSSRSVITLMLNEKEDIVKRVKKQVSKLIDVIKIDDLTGEGSFKRELILLMVDANDKNRMEITSLVDSFQGRIIDVSDETMMIEFNGIPRVVTSFLKIFSKYGIRQVARTGTIALNYHPSEK